MCCLDFNSRALFCFFSRRRTLVCAFEITKELLERVYLRPWGVSWTEPFSFFSRKKYQTYFLSCILRYGVKIWDLRSARPCESIARGSATAPSPVFLRFKARENQHNREVKLEVYGKRQNKNFCRLSSALCTVESKYLYFQWIVRNTFLFLYDLFKDNMKRIEKQR